MYRSAVRTKLFVNVSRREGTSRLCSQPLLLQNVGVASTAQLRCIPSLLICNNRSLRHFTSDVRGDSQDLPTYTISSSETEASGIANVAPTTTPKPSLHEVYTLKAHQAMSRGNAKLGRSIMGEMRENKIPPTIETMNELLSVVDVQNNKTLAQKYFEEITEFNMVPNASSYHRLAHSYALTGDVEGVEKVLSDSLAAGYPKG